MAKFTFILGIVFVANTLSLGYLYNQEQNVSIAEQIERGIVPSTPESPRAPTAPIVPKTE